MLRLITAICLMTTVTVSAQDAYLHHFYGNESSFNPAFTGQQGALRLGVSHRAQWGAAGAPAYVSEKVVLEESLPCLFFDYGFFARRDEEGAGKLTTSELGGSIAFAMPITWNNQRKDDGLSLRFGGSLTFGERRVDFSALNFLDQIDPFFGLVDANDMPNPTGFITPASAGNSPSYTTGAVGFSVKGGLNARSKHPLNFDLGAAIHNPGFFTGPDSRQTASLLGLDNALGRRLVFTSRADWVIKYNKLTSWSVRPSAVYQTQEGLTYFEGGAAINRNQLLTLGAYYHTARTSSVGRNVSWTSLRVEVGDRIGETQTRLDISISYALQNGFLKNYVRPPLEFSAVFSFGKSSTCAVLGFDDDETWTSKNNPTGCANFLKTKNKLYDNIWYKYTPW
jgi:type IX secretion system PorP/SprF family membrane protein